MYVSNNGLQIDEQIFTKYGNDEPTKVQRITKINKRNNMKQALSSKDIGLTVITKGQKDIILQKGIS
jgi:hypothetical protein